jgi:hypothetical protein
MLPNKGGLIQLEPDTFLRFCQDGGDLRIKIDPDGQIEEMDELNNEASIKSVTVSGGVNDYCNSELWF